MNKHTMTYTQFLEFLAQAYEKHARDKRGSIAFMCVTLVCMSPDRDEKAVRNLFEDFSGCHIKSENLSDHVEKLINTIEENRANYCTYYPDLGTVGEAYSRQRMQSAFKTRVQNPNKLRAMLLRKWAEESVLE